MKAHVKGLIYGSLKCHSEFPLFGTVGESVYMVEFSVVGIVSLQSVVYVYYTFDFHLRSMDKPSEINKKIRGRLGLLGFQE